ncbi:hypothetical protein [Listeria ilorinensis]|uniref:hypothetical protein n=1 Tax=Listeria ilorinensis TaxID=2867439 RepID=UPI001EF5BA27|nr:hypothetical protein [Listeria ilorinensis]
MKFEVGKIYYSCQEIFEVTEIEKDKVKCEVFDTYFRTFYKNNDPFTSFWKNSQLAEEAREATPEEIKLLNEVRKREAVN